MPTVRQRKAIEKMVENGGVVSRAMSSSGYSLGTAKTPSKLTESKGYKELLEEYGLTEGLITKALVEDIKAKPEKRVPELNLGAEILGMKKAPPQETPKNVSFNFFNNQDFMKTLGQLDSIAKSMIINAPTHEDN